MYMAKIKNFLDGWYRHRAVLTDLLNVIPDDQVHFKPWDNGMSLGELAIHIAGAAKKFVNLVKTGVFEGSGEKITFATMDDVRRLVQTYTEQTRADLESISDEQYDTVVDATKVFGFQAPAYVFLNLMKEHEIHHKGQLFVYARMVGAETIPFFIQR
jgi:uncharacterized damage-inducible protein DinB